MFSFCLLPAEKRHFSLFCTITGCVEIAIQNYGTFRRRAPGCLGAMPLENARGQLDLLNPLPMEERDSLTTQQVSQSGVLHTESCLLEGLCFLEGAHSVFQSSTVSQCQDAKWCSFQVPITNRVEATALTLKSSWYQFLLLVNRWTHKGDLAPGIFLSLFLPSNDGSCSTIIG